MLNSTLQFIFQAGAAVESKVGLKLACSLKQRTGCDVSILLYDAVELAEAYPIGVAIHRREFVPWSKEEAFSDSDDWNPVWILSLVHCDAQIQSKLDAELARLLP